jgi:MinD superfamily P-loop ATPase
VIASITGADLVLVVTEPTLSGLHDFERVIGLTRHFAIPSMVVVNKYDINEANTRRVEELATRLGTGVAGRVRFDPAVTEAQVEGAPLVEHSSNGAASDVVDVWKRVRWTLSEGGFVT